MDTRKDTARGRRTTRIVGAFALLLVASALRIYKLGDQNYWHDETYSLITSAGNNDRVEQLSYGTILPHILDLTSLRSDSTMGRIWSARRYDIHPPLYFMTLLQWRRCWGDSEIAVRAFSAASSLLSLVLIFVLLQRTKGATVAWIGAILCTMAYSHIAMAQDARSYSMALCWVLLSALTLFLIERNWQSIGRMPRLTGLLLIGVSWLSALLTHYETGLVLLAQGVYVGLWMRGSLRRSFWIMGAVVALVFVLMLPSNVWGRLRAPEGVGWLVENTRSHTWQSLIRLASLPFRLLIRCDGGSVNGMHAIIGIVLLGYAAAVSCFRRARIAIFFALWYFIPTTTLAVVDLSTHAGSLGHLRYAFLSLPGLVGLLAISLWNTPSAPRWVVVAAIVLGASFRLSYPTRLNPQAGAAAAFVSRVVCEDDLIVLDGRESPAWFAQSLYVRLAYYMRSIRCHLLLLRESPSPATSDAIGGFARVLVIRGRMDPMKEAQYPQHSMQEISQNFRGIGPILIMARKAP